MLTGALGVTTARIMAGRTAVPKAYSVPYLVVEHHDRKSNDLVRTCPYGIAVAVRSPDAKGQRPAVVPSGCHQPGQVFTTELWARKGRNGGKEGDGGLVEEGRA